MVAADAQAVAVTGDHPYHEIRTRHLQPGGDGRSTAVNRVEAVGVHVVGETAGAADPGDEHDLFLRNAEFRKDLLHLSEDGIVPTAWAPADVLIGDKIFSRQFRSSRRTHTLFLQHPRDFRGDLRDFERSALDLVEANGIDQIFGA